MTVTRIVQLTLDSAERVRRAAEEGHRIFGEIPGVKSFWAGQDGAKIVLLIGFADEAAIAPYVEHPLHRAYVDAYLAPFATEKLVTNYVAV